MKFWADENLHRDILNGIITRYPNLDVIRIQDTPYKSIDDINLLEEAAKYGAVLITHDVRTITKHAYERISAGLSMPGVIEIVANTSIKQAIDDLAVMIEAGTPADFENQVRYIPLR